MTLFNHTLWTSLEHQFWDLLVMIAISDFLLKYSTILIKTMVLMSSGKILSHNNQVSYSNGIISYRHEMNFMFCCSGPCLHGGGRCVTNNKMFISSTWMGEIYFEKQFMCLYSNLLGFGCAVFLFEGWWMYSVHYISSLFNFYDYHCFQTSTTK